VVAGCPIPNPATLFLGVPVGLRSLPRPWLTRQSTGPAQKAAQAGYFYVGRRKQGVEMSRLFTGKKKLCFVIPFAAVVLLLAIWLWSASPDTVFRIIRYNTSGIDDYKIFPSRPLRASQTPFRFIEGSDESRVPQIITFGEERDIPLDELLKSNDTVAFLVIKDDTILFERYYDGYNQSSSSLSFSMAKSFSSILIGCAIDDGYIQSVDQPVTDFVPELAKNGYEHVTIKQ
jgi:hypothetical protein